MPMRPFRAALPLAVLLAALVLAGCQPVAAPAVAVPTATALPPTATRVPPTATPLPPTPTPAPPTATATASVPDAKADPMAALLFASTGKHFQSATFTYDMGMTMAPADDASAKALGPAADQIAQITIQANGQGALQVVDAAAGKSNMRMDMEMATMGQKVRVEIIIVGKTSWTRAGGQGPWQKIDLTANGQGALPGMNPEEMIKSFTSATHVQWLEDTQLAGEKVRHLKFSMDPAKIDMSAFSQGLAAGSSGKLSDEEKQTMLKNMAVDAEAWLAAKDLQLRQEKVAISLIMPVPQSSGAAIDARLKADITMTMRFDNINQPVKIEPPAGES